MSTKFLLLALFTVIGDEVSACGGVVAPHIRRTEAATSQRHILRRDAGDPALQTVTNQDNITHWTVEQNTRQMQISDDAFNERDLGRFNHAEDIKVYQGGSIANLSEHLSGIELVYASTDLHLHNHDYKIIFGEGDWTVAVETITGIQNGPLTSLTGTYLPPTNKPVQYDLMTIARWNNGWMKDEYLWSDDVLTYRQLGVLPDMPAWDLPDLELNLATPLTTASTYANSSALNKAAMKQSDDSLSAGNFTIEALNLSPDAKIFGLSDQPLGPQGYIDWLKNMKVAFPDLRLEIQSGLPLVGQGDWTGSAALLSGTHKGNLTLPAYISNKPIPATGNSFDQLHYTIARWQSGKIVGLRINMDLFALAGALNIPL